jgi:hypothetical protein
VNDDGFPVWIGEGGSFDNPQWGSDGPVIGGRTVKWGTPFPGFCRDQGGETLTQYCPLGNSIPEYRLGLSTIVSWRGFSAYALLTRSAGFDLWDPLALSQGINDQQEVPEANRKPIGYFNGWREISTGVGTSSISIRDGTFTKFQELSVSYLVSPGLLERVPGLGSFNAVSLKLTGQNLYTWSDYPGYDPDVGAAGGDTGSAAINRFDTGAYPHMRTFTGSVEIVF